MCDCLNRIRYELTVRFFPLYRFTASTVPPVRKSIELTGSGATGGATSPVLTAQAYRVVSLLLVPCVPYLRLKRQDCEGSISYSEADQYIEGLTF
jgi:hypothetical protein